VARARAARPVRHRPSAPPGRWAVCGRGARSDPVDFRSRPSRIGPTRCWPARTRSSRRRARPPCRPRCTNRPMVIVYKLSPLTYRLGIRFVQVDTYGMVNSSPAGGLCGADPGRLHARGHRGRDAALSHRPAHAAVTRAALAEVRERLGGAGASRRRQRPCCTWRDEIARGRPAPDRSSTDTAERGQQPRSSAPASRARCRSPASLRCPGRGLRQQLQAVPRESGESPCHA